MNAQPQKNKNTGLRQKVPPPKVSQLERVASEAHALADKLWSGLSTTPQRVEAPDQERKGSARPKLAVRREERKVPMGSHLNSGKRADRTFTLSATNDSEPVGIVQNSSHEFQTPRLEYNEYHKKLGSLNITGLKGTEYLGTIRQIGTSSKVSLFNQLINPVYVQGSRLAAMAKMFTRWRPRSVKFHFAPSVSSLAGGSYAMAILPDSAGTFLEAGEALARKVMSIDHALIANSFTPGHTAFTWDSSNEWAYVDSESEDDRFAALAQFIMIQMSNTSLTANSALGELFVEYDFEFCGTIAPSDSSAFSTDITFAHAYTAADPFGFLVGDISSGSLDTQKLYTAIVVSSSANTTFEYEDGSSGGVISGSIVPGLIMYLTFTAGVWLIYPSPVASGMSGTPLTITNNVTPSIVLRVLPIGG